jgi:hypothetical protein
MFVEFHTLDGKDLFVNFGAVVWVEDHNGGSLLMFANKETLQIKETITDIKRQFSLMAMQGQLSGKN